MFCKNFPKNTDPQSQKFGKRCSRIIETLENKLQDEEESHKYSFS